MADGGYGYGGGYGAPPLVVYTDGAARGNPGPSSVGVYVPSDGTEIGRQIGSGTNNEAEYRAVIEALDVARARGASRVEVRSDSELLVRQMSGEYRVRAPNLVPLAEQVRQTARSDFDEVSFRHVPRAQNAEADRAANKALDRGSYQSGGGKGRR